MKKLFSISLFAACVLGWGALFAQCTIDVNNTTTGFTPDPATAITQGVAYAQCTQVYVPSTITVSGITATVDSMHIDSIGNLPSGILPVYNPTSKTVAGGGHGTIYFSGTTNDAVGAYALVFYGTAYATVLGSPQTFQLNQPPVSTDFTYSFTVQAGAPSACDTLFNLALDTTTTYYTAGYTADSGYVSGNNIYGDLSKVEGFATTTGNYVNSAVLYFAVATVAAADTGSLVTVGVWDNTGTSDASNVGAPGNMIDSVHVSMGEIAASLTSGIASNSLVGLLVNFHGVTAPGDTVYIGVVLPTNAGDTVAFFTNGVPALLGDGWEQNSDGSWGTYNNDWQFGGNIGNLIIADICSAPASGYPNATFSSVPASEACVSSPVAFTDASTSSPTPSIWNWSFGDGTSSSAKNPSHTYTTTGSYVVTESVANNLGGAIQAFTTATSTITVNASPAASIATTEASSASATDGSEIVTASGGASPYSYVWSAGSSTSDTLTGVAPGTYTVTVTDANSCTSTAAATIDVTGIITLSNSTTVKMYPNPATDVLNLVWSQQLNAEISIIDMNGNVINSILTNSDMKTAFDIHNLAAGSYIVRITDKTSNQQKSMQFSKF